MSDDDKATAIEIDEIETIFTLEWHTIDHTDGWNDADKIVPRASPSPSVFLFKVSAFEIFTTLICDLN